MSRVRADGAAPTMIIPRGAEIRLDDEGQLSIRTPGNLVLQTSGTYGVLESVSGSIRIEPGAEIEAVLVRSAESCVIAGRLTAWKVEARIIELENDAQANIMLQETEHLEVGRDARLVGNFGSEKELFLLFSRFARQLRAMPLFAAGRDAAPTGGELADALLPAGSPAPGSPAPGSPAPAGTAKAATNGTLPKALRRALDLLEEDGGRPTGNGAKDRIVEQIASLLRDHDLETLAATHRTLFLRVVEPSDRIAQAAKLVAEHFQST